MRVKIWRSKESNYSHPKIDIRHRRRSHPVSVDQRVPICLGLGWSWLSYEEPKLGRFAVVNVCKWLNGQVHLCIPSLVSKKELFPWRPSDPSPYGFRSWTILPSKMVLEDIRAWSSSHQLTSHPMIFHWFNCRVLLKSPCLLFNSSLLILKSHWSNLTTFGEIHLGV